jgi:hypothetical protein
MTDDALREVVDRMQIVENLARYHHTVDAKDWAGLSALLTEDVVAEYRSLNDIGLFGLEGTYEGRTVVVDWIRTGQEPFQFNGAPTHFMTNHVIELSGDEASSRSYFNDVDLPTGLMIGTGIYTCRHVRTVTGWKIRSMRLEQRLCDTVVDSIASQRSVSRREGQRDGG